MNQGPVQTLLVADSLYPIGGVERCWIRLLRYFDRRAVSPKMVVLGRQHPREPDLPADVPVQYLGRDHVRGAVLPLARIIGAEEPGIVYSAKTHVNAIAVAANLLAGHPSCAIPSERVDLLAHFRNQLPSRQLKWCATLLIAGLLYQAGAEKVVFVSRGARDAGSRALRLPADKSAVIHNPVVDSELLEASKNPVSHPWFVGEDRVPIVLGVGRLTEQKGFSYLLRAFRTVRSKLHARLVVIGTGQRGEALVSLAEKLDVAQDVAFVGFQSNPFKYMARSDVFVLPSLWEGFGLVLVEAMACGIPVVATRCPSGPEEIVTDGVNGLLVQPGDADGLAMAILEVLTNPPLARHLSTAGQRRAEDFSVEKAAREYEQLFRSVLSARETDVCPEAPDS